jgi:hypothetical protein
MATRVSKPATMGMRTEFGFVEAHPPYRGEQDTDPGPNVRVTSPGVTRANSASLQVDVEVRFGSGSLLGAKNTGPWPDIGSISMVTPSIPVGLPLGASAVASINPSALSGYAAPREE